MSKSLDPAREWAIYKEGERSQYCYCKFCQHKITGGITRLKHHLAGDHIGVAPCKLIPPHVKETCQESLLQIIEQKTKKAVLIREIGRMGSPEVDSSSHEIDSISGSNSQNQSRTIGPLDPFVNLNAPQTTIENRFKKEAREDVVRAIGRCIYANGLSFNLLNSPYWQRMIELVGNFGRGLKQPSAYEIRTRVLKAEVEGIEAIKATHKKAWVQYGCTIMSDGWSDGKGRSLINFLVNSPEGTFFYKSIDASDSFKTGDYLFKCLDGMVEEIGEENVLQVIIDNHSSYVNAGKKLMEKRKKLYWTPCAAHCIDLMLEDIGKLKIHKETLELAKAIVSFIYNHCWVLAFMRKHTGDKELLRPAITRFATAFLTLQRLYALKQPIRNMFMSDEFSRSTWAKKPNGIKARNAVLYDKAFWGRVLFCFTTTLPLVAVLREVDSDARPSMPYLYELMDSAKEKIAVACNGIERKYKLYWNLIDDRWTNMMHRPIHAAAYYLNPKYFYGDNFSTHPEVRRGLRECMARMISNISELAQVDVELDAYKERIGDFGSDLAKMTINSRSPASWWERFGEQTPLLQKFAIRVLSLTTSASGCERNWSTFQQVHSKKRCRLEQQRLNDLVYVMYNIKLRERNIWRKNKRLGPILLDEVSPDDEWIVEVEDPLLPTNPTWLDEENLEAERDYLDVTAISGHMSLDVDNEDGGDSGLPPRAKKQRVDGSSSSSVQRRKGIQIAIVDEEQVERDAYDDLEDSNLILREDDLELEE